MADATLTAMDITQFRALVYVNLYIPIQKLVLVWRCVYTFLNLYVSLSDSNMYLNI